MVSKDDFVAWRNDPVTHEFLNDMREMIDEQIAALVRSAGVEASQDRRRVGTIEGLKWLIEWRPLFQVEDTDGIDGSRSSHNGEADFDEGTD